MSTGVLVDTIIDYSGRHYDVKWNPYNQQVHIFVEQWIPVGKALSGNEALNHALDWLLNNKIK